MDETRDDVVEHFVFDDEVEKEESLNIESMFGDRNIPANLSIPHNSKEKQTPKPGSKMGSIRTGLFSWRKNRSARQERRVVEDESRDDVLGPDFVYNLSVVPTKSEDLPLVSTDGSRNDGVAFPVPNEEGQELALQDEEHCYEDPANVHSMLTMPSFEAHDDRSTHNRVKDAIDDDAIAIVLTNTEDGDLVTDDGALYIPRDDTDAN